MARFEVTTAIEAPPQLVFGLSLEIETHTASMADSGERAIGGVTSGRMKLGDTVTWQARHFGLRWRMTARSAGRYRRSRPAQQVYASADPCP